LQPEIQQDEIKPWPDLRGKVRQLGLTHLKAAAAWRQRFVASQFGCVRLRAAFFSVAVGSNYRDRLTAA
jgi:hypothetical protein